MSAEEFIYNVINSDNVGQLDLNVIANTLANTDSLIRQIKTQKVENDSLKEKISSLRASALQIKQLYEAEVGKNQGTVNREEDYIRQLKEQEAKASAAENARINAELREKETVAELERRLEQSREKYDDLAVDMVRSCSLLMDNSLLPSDQQGKFRELRNHVQNLIRSGREVPGEIVNSLLKKISSKKKRKAVADCRDAATMTVSDSLTTLTVGINTINAPPSLKTSSTSTHDLEANFSSNFPTTPLIRPLTSSKTTADKSTMYSSSTITRSTCTSAFIKRVDVGVNYPEVVPKSIEDILRECIIPIPSLLSPILDELPVPTECAQTQTDGEPETVQSCRPQSVSCGTNTSLRNVRRKVGYIRKMGAAFSNQLSHIKKEEALSPASSIQNLPTAFYQNEHQFDCVNPQLSQLWGMLGDTMFRLLGVKRTFDNQGYNSINERLTLINNIIDTGSSRGTQEMMSEMLAAAAAAEASIVSGRKDVSMEKSMDVRQGLEKEVAVAANQQKCVHVYKDVLTDDTGQEDDVSEFVPLVHEENEITNYSADAPAQIPQTVDIIEPSTVSEIPSILHDKAEQSTPAVNLLTEKERNQITEPPPTTAKEAMVEQVLCSAPAKPSASSATLDIPFKELDDPVQHAVTLTDEYDEIANELRMMEEGVVDGSAKIEKANDSAALVNVLSDDTAFTDVSDSDSSDAKTFPDSLITSSCSEESVAEDPLVTPDGPATQENSTSSESSDVLIVPNVSSVKQDAAACSDTSVVPNKLVSPDASTWFSASAWLVVPASPDQPTSQSSMASPDSSSSSLSGAEPNSNMAVPAVFSCSNLTNSSDKFYLDVPEDECNNVSFTDDETDGMVVAETSPVRLSLSSSSSVTSIGSNGTFISPIKVKETNELVKDQFKTPTSPAISKRKLKERLDGNYSKRGRLSPTTESLLEDDWDRKFSHIKDYFALPSSLNPIDESNGKQQSLVEPLEDEEEAEYASFLEFGADQPDSFMLTSMRLCQPLRIETDATSSSAQLSDSPESPVEDLVCPSSTATMPVWNDFKKPLHIHTTFPIATVTSDTDSPESPSIEDDDSPRSPAIEATIDPCSADRFADSPLSPPVQCRPSIYSDYEPKIIPLEHPLANQQLLEISNTPICKTIAKYSTAKRAEVLLKIAPQQCTKQTEIISNLTRLISQYLKADWTAESVETCSSKMLNVTKDCKLLSSVIIESAVKSGDVTLDVQGSPPAPPLPRVTQQLVLLIKTLGESLYILDRVVLSEIDRKVFTLKSDKVNMDATTIMTYLYIGVSDCNRVHGCTARLYIYKCLYYFNFKGLPLIYYVLKAFPHALPKKGSTYYDNSDAMVGTLRTVLMNINYMERANQMDAHLYKKNELQKLLKYFYGYQQGAPTYEELITNLVEKIKANKLKNVDYCLILVAKRKGYDWAKVNIVQKHLYPLLNDYLKQLNADEKLDDRICCLIFAISAILKTQPNCQDVSGVMQMFGNIVQMTDGNSRIQEAAVAGLMRFTRFGFADIYEWLTKWNPSYPVSDRIKLMMATFVHRKEERFWQQLSKREIV